MLPGAGEADGEEGPSGLLGVEPPPAVVCARVVDGTLDGTLDGAISVGDPVGDSVGVGDPVVLDGATVVDDTRGVEDAAGADGAPVLVDASAEVDAGVVESAVPLIQRRKLCTTARKPNGDSHRRRQQTARRGRIRSCC